MSYLDLLKLASPEAIIVLIALAVLTIGLASDRARAFPGIVAALGIVIAIWTTMRLPLHANLFGGMLATHIGESKTAVISGALTIMAGVLFFLRLPALKKIVRPIYRSKGIIVGELEEDS